MYICLTPCNPEYKLGFLYEFWLSKLRSPCLFRKHSTHYVISPVTQQSSLDVKIRDHIKNPGCKSCVVAEDWAQHHQLGSVFGPAVLSIRVSSCCKEKLIWCRVRARLNCTYMVKLSNEAKGLWWSSKVAVVGSALRSKTLLIGYQAPFLSCWVSPESN